MSLAGFALRFKTIIVTTVVLLMGWGMLSYLSMPRREDPEYIVRVCQVLARWPGTPAEKMEELVTFPLEAEINTLDGLRWIYSETTVGVSAIYVELDKSTPGDQVSQMWDKVRSRALRVPMPDPSVQPMVIDDFGDTNIMLMALYQTPLPGDREVREENRYTPRQLDIFSDRINDELKLLRGVAKVSRVGVQQEAIYIETDLGTWTRLSLTTNELQQLVARRNIIAPGGVIDTDVGRFSINPSGDIDAVQQLNTVIVGLQGEARSPVYLDDLGLTVVRDYQDPPVAITRYGDPEVHTPCVIVAFTMKRGSNIVTICDDVRRLMERLTVEDKILPPDLGVGFVSDQSENVTRKINDFVANVIGAVVIVVLVVVLMVGFRSASVMAANIPLVIIGSLAIVPLFGVQLEQISLAAMIIALGMLVDNAVQIADQSRRLQSEGMTPFEAAKAGSDELAFPILIATGTTIAAFFPMLLGLKGSTREYIYSLPVTITVVLGLSYFLAMTFCVLLAYWFIRPPKDPTASLSPVIRLFQLLGKKKRPEAAPADAKPGLLASLFPAMVSACIRARLLVVLVAFVLLVGTFMLPIGSEFFPKDIRDQFTVEVWLPEGANIEQTDRATRQVEEIIRKLSPYTDEEGNPGQRLRAMASCVGKGMDRWYLGRNPESPKPSFAEIVVRTTDGTLTPQYADDVREVCVDGDPARGIVPVVGARVIPKELMMGPAVDAPIGIRIYAPRLGVGFADPKIVRQQADRLKELFRNHPGTWDVYDTWGAVGFRLDVLVDEDKANLAGVTNLGLARSLNAFYSGHYLTTFREGDHQIPVYLRLPSEQRASIAELDAAYVEGLFGKVPLDAVAKPKPAWQLAKIERRHLLRKVEVRARVRDGFTANDIVNDVLTSDEFKDWEANLPPGYKWETGGELFESQTSRSELGISLLISLLAIILLLIIQYNGIVKPIIILATLPLALIGALGGLYITGYPLGFMPQLGLLSLFGIVVNTAIIFLEFADRLIEDKARACDGSGPILGLTVAEFRECLVKAGQVRLLPIAMTTLTTIGGLLPLALAGGPLWEGMAWLMIFGLIGATLLTLIVVPSLYAIFVVNLKVTPLPKPAAEAIVAARAAGGER